ncbi:bifunctional molybdenum cofactor biosynthesis protein MoaC/MoaB [Gordonia sp. TBRC 11910]|uniref:Cyclic pyranopterin monophosphate synthase n=1 Tax=Gordonia asplenii TaxID=2725283 RepID=A0A848KN22_9ACTN|nr:bifunctional molybdenum cofactor biosynthesis protein MoaC/MoaB [Gordonia asplenii]NMN99611.1 bifunctional molybdenum cofactor biosynthesis protein MoaC/MoaB [Gordonia asplenii]
MAADPVDPAASTTLSHVAADGSAHMVDVSAKEVTDRTATARGVFRTTPHVISLISSGAHAKGDVLAVARIAGIMGAKRTSDLIPLCHQLPLNAVDVNFELTADTVVVTATASTTGRTGVEMEALTAVSVAGLTLHDMVKAVDPAASMTDVALWAKDGGRRGEWRREESSVDTASGVAPGTVDIHPGRRALVLVSSTRIATGERSDATGPVLRDWLSGKGFDVEEPIICADADIAAGVRDALARHPALLITTGGTGPTSDDHTPEATAPHLTTELPGIAEAMRETGRASTPYSSLSRGLAGFAGRTLVVNLPGSKGGVKDGIAVLDPLISHLFHLADGGGH